MKEQLKSLVRGLSVRYAAAYASVCGRHPRVRPWHFQWHAVRELNRDLAVVLPGVTGKVLDFGCGLQPYRSLLTTAGSYTGVDVCQKPGVDVVLDPEAALPFPDGSFDAVLCTQVLEHVADLDGRLAELHRVLKPGGVLVASVPFIYHLHDRPHDYRRLSEFGALRALRGFSLERIYRQGAIGSTLAVLGLGWVEHQTDLNALAWLGKALLSPLWVALCLAVNLAALGFDRLDSTRAFYHNLLLVGRRP